MRAFNKLYNRFEWAITNKKQINPNKEDVQALNELAEFIEQKKQNTNLEDSLLLFWILCNWKISLKGQKVKLEESKRGALVLPEISQLFDKLSLLLNPKDFVISETVTELQMAQREAGNEITITEEDVREMFDDMLSRVKQAKYPISNISKFEKLVIKETPLSAGERQMLGL